MNEYKRWKDGRVEGWKDGRVEGRKGGRVEGWKSGRMEEWKDGRMEVEGVTSSMNTLIRRKDGGSNFKDEYNNNENI